MRLALRCALPLLFAAPAAAQLDVAVLGAPPPSQSCYLPDAVTKIQATGFFNTVDTINVGTTTPALAQLVQYDALLVFSDAGFQNAVVLGDTLADYVDTGRGVVVTTFANAHTSLDLEGRWQMGYEVILPTGQQQGSQEFLGTVHQPSHPVMSGVTSFDGGWNGQQGSFRPAGVSLALGAIPIADWTDGIPLVVQGMNPQRVDLGFYPPSSSCDGRFWNVATDGDLLMGNALVFVAGGNPSVGTNYCGPAVANSTGQGATIGATGSASAAANDVTLSCTDMPPNQFGYFLNSQTQAFVFPVPNSQGALCLGGAIGRYNGQIQNSGANGEISLALDLPNTPTPSGTTAIVAGQTWNFTCWYRDNNPGTTSNFSDGLSVQFN